MHSNLVNVNNMKNDKLFDTNDSFCGCCLADFFDVPRQSDKNGFIFKVMQAVWCYIQQDGHFMRNEKVFEPYLSCFDSSNSAADASLNNKCRMKVQYFVNIDNKSDWDMSDFEFEHI